MILKKLQNLWSESNENSSSPVAIRLIPEGLTSLPHPVRTSIEASLKVGAAEFSLYAAAMLPLQPECSQPQAMSVVPFAASQYGLQYLLSVAAGQLQSSCAHLFCLASVMEASSPFATLYFLFAAHFKPYTSSSPRGVGVVTKSCAVEM